VPVFERKRNVTLKETVRFGDYVDEITSSSYDNRAKYLFSLLSTANGAIWDKVTKSAFLRALRHPKWYLRPAAIPIAGYMTAFWAVKSLTDPFPTRK
jgi:hypothetical protein